MDRSRHGAHLDWKAALAEHLDHAVVLGQHLGLEGVDPMLDRHLGEMGQQDRAQSTALQLVAHRERDLGSPFRAAEIGAVADGPPVLAPRGDKAVTVRVVDVHGPIGLRLDIGPRREEPKAAGVRGQPAEEVCQRRPVSLSDRAHMDGRAVTQYHVGLATGRIFVPHR